MIAEAPARLEAGRTIVEATSGKTALPRDDGGG